MRRAEDIEGWPQDPLKTGAPDHKTAARRRYNFNWERLVIRLSAEFIRVDAESIDDAIDAAIDQIGKFSGADRCYIFLYDPLHDTMSNTHEWCRSGIESQKTHLQQLPASVWPAWMEQLHHLRIVNWPRVRALPDDASAEREALMSQGVQSVVAVPMLDGERLLGFVGFDAVFNERPWTVDEIHLLQMSSNIITNAMIRRKSETELSAAREQLMRTTKMEALGRFVAGTAHNFNNLLTVILGNCEVSTTDTDAESLRGRIKHIRGAAEKAAGLTRSLLGFGKRQFADPRVFDVNGLVRRTEVLLDHLLGENIIVTVDLDPNAGAVVADLAQFEHVLFNLATNARDAMPDGGTLVLRTKRLSDPPGDPRVRIEVRDTGVGMDEPTLFHAFEPFFTTKEAQAGSGLGLSSVHGIVLQSGGAIDIRSTPGQGTTVRVDLPSVSETAQITPRTTEKKALKGRVLLVEDDPQVLEVLKSSLMAADLDVVGVERAEEALSLLDTSCDFDLLISDLVMPGMGGSRLIQQVRDLHQSLPIIAISGYSEDARELVERAGERTKLLSKPFTPSRLVDVVRALLEEPV